MGIPKPIIEVATLSKQYRLGSVGVDTLKDDLKRWWHRFRGKGDPFLTVGETNDRTIIGSNDYVWALRNINFEVYPGEVLGIIGKNGAGKSTLLKILSRVTVPTIGKVVMNGRVASLLEVGTGFHPDLTGRENVFLNGAILGMSKREIQAKFDEIVSFAGVERYIDTPVKRYSSGMFVRLGFAVAAHLDPEILIVDEVLAVGDIDFQKKCLAKMKDISDRQQRTVLFVSHNLTAIKNLCTRTILFENGALVDDGDTESVVNNYLNTNTERNMRLLFNTRSEAPGNEKVTVKRFELVPRVNNPADGVFVHTPIDVEFEFWNEWISETINLSLHVYNAEYECVFNVGTAADFLGKGLYKGVCQIPGNLLNDNTYHFSMMIVGDSSYAIYTLPKMLTLDVLENRAASSWHGKWPGYVRPQVCFSLNHLND